LHQSWTLAERAFEQSVELGVAALIHWTRVML
jgi:hypothetical protein